MDDNDMDQKRCVLHIGTMKTGTSSVQAHLAENSSRLRSEGWYYPGWPARDIDVIAQAASEAAGRFNLVISDEGIWHRTRTKACVGVEMAAALAEFKTTVVVYLRRPDKFIESYFKQRVREFKGPYTVSQFLSHEHTLQATAYLGKLDFLASMWGADNVVAVPYERSQLIGGEIVADVMGRMGLPESGCWSRTVPDAERRNASPDANMTFLSCLLDHITGRPTHLFDEPELDSVQGVVKPHTGILTLDERAELLRRFRPVFMEVQERYGAGRNPQFFEDWTTADEDAALLRAPFDAIVSEFVSLQLGRVDR